MIKRTYQVTVEIVVWGEDCDEADFRGGDRLQEFECESGRKIRRKTFEDEVYDEDEYIDELFCGVI